MTETFQAKKRRYTAGEITRVALRLFGERGFDEVTVDEIAAEVGISSRTFFRYFATKDEVLLQYQRRLNERMINAVAGRPPEEGPVTALRNAYLVTSTVPAEDREAVALQSRFLFSTRDLIARAHGERAADNGPIIELLAQRMGVDPAVDPRPETIAVSMGAAAGAAFHRWVAGGGRGDPADLIAAALDLLETGLASLEITPPRRRTRSA